MQDQVELILASASPRRAELLTEMGCCFVIQSADIDESRHLDESARNYVGRMASEKAHRVFENNSHRKVAVLAADTIVVQGEVTFSKPNSQQHAFEIWSQLADSQHSVITAVCLIVDEGGKLKADTQLVSSEVEFGTIDRAQMLKYWQSGEPQDKAGAYAIQGLASAWVKLIHGSYSNIVGLPLRETNEMLKSIGHHWL